MPQFPPAPRSEVWRQWGERFAVVLICLAAVAGPIALGATGPWERFGLEAVMAIVAAAWAVSGRRDPWSVAIPLAVAATLLLQVVPLPYGVLARIAPVSAGRWMVAHEGITRSWVPISIDPAATLIGIRRLLLGLATVMAVRDLARNGAHRRWIYTALAISGGVIWALGLLVRVDPKERLVMGFFELNGALEFWKTPIRGPTQTAGFTFLDWVTVGAERYQADGGMSGDGFGPYIYSNHFANALCLTLPALWMLWLLYTRNRLPAVVRFAVVLAAMAAAIWTSAALAGSRAGTVALGFAAIVQLALVAEHRWLRWTAGGLAALSVAALLAFVLVFEGPLSPLVSFLPEGLAKPAADLLANTRIVAAHVAGRMFLASPLLGTGLGTYSDLYPAFTGHDSVLSFAHNDFAQVLAEAGLVGGGVIAAFVWTLGRSLWRFCRERSAAGRLIDAAAWAALAGAAAHSIFDWNMHAPANAFLACVIVGLALSSVVPASIEPIVPSLRGRLTTAAFVVACLAVVPLLARDAATDRTLETLRRATTAARLAAKDPLKPSAAPALTSAIRAGEQSARLDPSNWRLAVLLGQALVHLSADPATGDEGAARRKAAETWFLEARRDCAATRGLPEPIP